MQQLELVINEGTSGELSLDLCIDGTPFGSHCIDLVELKDSAIASGGYDIQTCGCGSPGCSRFWEPIFVHHLGDIVQWEFDERIHPHPNLDDDEFDETAAPKIRRIHFDRLSYIEEIQRAFALLRHHPDKSQLGPYGFNPEILDEAFPDPSIPHYPFVAGSTMVVGYFGEYRHPWVWVEGDTVLNNRSLFPGIDLWSHYDSWYSMCGPESGRDEIPTCRLNSLVDVLECNRLVQLLAAKIQTFWGDAVNVVWEEISDRDATIISRKALAHRPPSMQNLAPV